MKSGLENHKSDSILEVFRELGLNDVKSREHFQDFANQEALHIRSNRVVRTSKYTRQH